MKAQRNSATHVVVDVALGDVAGDADVETVIVEYVQVGVVLAQTASLVGDSVGLTPLVTEVCKWPKTRGIRSSYTNVSNTEPSDRHKRGLRPLSTYNIFLQFPTLAHAGYGTSTRRQVQPCTSTEECRIRRTYAAFSYNSDRKRSDCKRLHDGGFRDGLGSHICERPPNRGLLTAGARGVRWRA